MCVISSPTMTNREHPLLRVAHCNKPASQRRSSRRHSLRCVKLGQDYLFINLSWRKASVLTVYKLHWPVSLYAGWESFVFLYLGLCFRLHLFNAIGGLVPCTQALASLGFVHSDWVCDLWLISGNVSAWVWSHAPSQCKLQTHLESASVDISALAQLVTRRISYTYFLNQPPLDVYGGIFSWLKRHTRDICPL